jgi:glycosyltransferase involved in cell wall biosynthesis
MRIKTAFARGSLPLVTIAIPTYNRAASYLPDTIKSALDQTYPRIEVMVSDNASTDETPALLANITDPRLRCSRHQANIGANRNFNYCLEQAAGDYFLLLHDDDLIDPDFVAACVAAADYKCEAGLIRTGIRVIDDRGRIIRESRNRVAGLPLAEFFFAWFDGKTSWYLANTLFHTRRLRELGGFCSTHPLIEDGFAIAQLAARYPRIDVEDVKSSFRVHGGEKTFTEGVSAVEWGKDYLQLLDLLCRLVSPDKHRSVQNRGMRFFARLTYQRARAITHGVRKLRVYLQVWRLFRYRYFPAHHFLGGRLAFRAADYARRRTQRLVHRWTEQSVLSP